MGRRTWWVVFDAEVKLVRGDVGGIRVGAEFSGEVEVEVEEAWRLLFLNWDRGWREIH